jgi:hypothetical protein
MIESLNPYTRMKMEEEKAKQAQESSRFQPWQPRNLDKPKPAPNYELGVETYESIINELRVRERELLNKKRRVVYEEHRPPKESWYTLKSRDFSTELHRNRVSLRPNDANRKLLTTLAITDLY